MRIAFAGDPHIGKMGTYMGDEAGLRRQRKLLSAVFARADDARADLIVVLGDLFDDPHPDQDRLVATVQALSSTKTPVLAYLGNHDVEDERHNSFKLLRRLPEAGALRHVTFVTKPKTIEYGGVRVRVLPWRKSYERKHLGERADVVLFHDSVVGAKRDNGHAVPEDGGLQHEFFGDAFTVSGHLHTPQRLRDLWYTGTQAQLSFGERPGKKFMLAEVRKSGTKMVVSDFESPWTLLNVKFDSDDPPKCDAPGTLYAVDLSAGSPGPRWLLDHPRVVRVHGGSGKARSKTIERVVELASKHGSSEDDDELLQRWLRQHTSLTKLERTRAAKIHRRLGDGD